jgi:hypothetical protein
MRPCQNPWVWVGGVAQVIKQLPEFKAQYREKKKKKKKSLGPIS